MVIEKRRPTPVERPIFATVLVGPGAMFREGLSRILSAAHFRIVASAASVDNVALSPSSDDPPILLIVHASSDRNAAVNEIRVFKERYPSSRVAVIADHDQLGNGDMVAALRAGAHGYFVKPSSDTLIKSLELVMLGETIVPAEIMSHMRDPHEQATPDDSGKSAEVMPEGEYMPRLSDRERRILRHLIEGDSNKTIARKSDIAEATVKVHVKAILRKIRVNNRTRAAIWGMNNETFLRTMAGPSPTDAQGKGKS